MAAPTIVGSAVLTGAGANSSSSTLVTAPVPSGTLDGDIIIVAIASNTTSGEGSIYALAPEVPASWTTIGVRTISNTLVYQVWAAPYTTSLDRTFRGNHATSRRVLPTSITIRGAATISNWILGAECRRPDTGTATTTVATTISSTSTDTLVLGIFAERTTATETDVAGVTGATKYSYHYDASSTSIETITYTQEVLATPQASGDTTVTYLNSQTLNGIGQHIGIPSASSIPAAFPERIGHVETYVELVPGAPTSSITLNPSVPTSGTTPQVNDWMVAVISVNGNNGQGILTIPYGWVLINESYITVNTYNTYVLARRRLATDTSYTFTNSGDRAINGVLMWIRGGERLSKWAVGTPKKREDAPAETTTITALPLVAPATSLVLSFAFERTTATELATDVVVTGTTKWFTAVHGVDATVNISVAYEPVATGSSAQVTFTYPHIQATNGWGCQIAIPGTATFDGYPVMRQMANGPQEARVYYMSGSGPAQPSDIHRVGEGYSTVAAMLTTDPFYVAHRGGSRSWPEMSLHAYTQAIVKGFKAIELSLARTSDGVWFGLHDQTLDRTSGVTGVTASSLTWAQVQTYNILGSVAVDDPTQPNRPYMSLDELLDLYYPSHVIFIDPKYQLSNRAELFTIINALPGTPQDHIVFKYYGVEGNLAGTSGLAFDAGNLGYQRWGYFYDSDAANFANYQGRWSILGMEYPADQPTWDTIKSYGKPVIGHICPNQAAVDLALSKGADGLMVSGANVITLT